MPSATLHYIFDPFCGWCYAVAPLIEAAASLPELTVTLHGGGMLAGANRRQIDAGWRDYVMPHDERIAQMSGQPFGSAYFDGLLRDIGAEMDSAQPIAAILAATALNGQGLAMLHQLQSAHYVAGQRISETPVLIQLATALGHDANAFTQALHDQQGAATEAHIAASRSLLGQLGGQGFPTVALAHADGRWQVLPVSQYLGQADAWRNWLSTQLV